MVRESKDSYSGIINDREDGKEKEVYNNIPIHITRLVVVEVELEINGNRSLFL